jgi:DNA-binding CsgD family transcriptional regulator
MDAISPSRFRQAGNVVGLAPRFVAVSPHWWVRHALAGFVREIWPHARVDLRAEPEAPSAYHNALLITDTPDWAKLAENSLCLPSHWQSQPAALRQAIEKAVRDAEKPDAPEPGSRRRNTGATGLTRRQQDVLACIAEGLGNAEVARRLSMSENTVRIHVSAILRTLNVVNRTQAALWARQQLSFPASIQN